MEDVNSFEASKAMLANVGTNVPTLQAAAIEHGHPALANWLEPSNFYVKPAE